MLLLPDTVSFSLEERVFLVVFVVRQNKFLSRRAFFGNFSGGCLTLNVDHFNDHHSPIGARVSVMEVQLRDTKIFRDDPGEAQ